MPTELNPADNAADLWIFAYGSLMWRPDFEFAEKKRAVAYGYTRRLWQGSTDHRGVPDAPGRVATLVADPRERCCGIAYRITAAQKATVLPQLDVREQGGYERTLLEITMGPTKLAAVTYVAAAQNPHYLGEAEAETIAEQVRSAVGPSGHNTEYVLRLAAFLAEHEIHEPHIYEVANLLIDPDNVFDEA